MQYCLERFIWFVLTVTTRPVSSTETKTKPTWSWFSSQGTAMSRAAVPQGTEFLQGHQTTMRCLHESLSACSWPCAFNHQAQSIAWHCLRSSGESTGMLKETRRHFDLLLRSGWMSTSLDSLVQLIEVLEKKNWRSLLDERQGFPVFWTVQLTLH